MRIPNVLVAASSSYCEPMYTVGFTMPENVLLYAVFSLLGNNGERTRKGRARLKKLLREKKFNGSLNTMQILSHKDLNDAKFTYRGDKLSLSQYTSSHGAFIALGMGDQDVTTETYQIIAKKLVFGLVEGIEQGIISWFPGGELRVRIIWEDRNMMTWFEKIDKVYVKRFWRRNKEALKVFVEALIESAAQFQDLIVLDPFRNREEKLSFSFHISTQDWDKEILEKKIVPAAMKKVFSSSR